MYRLNKNEIDKLNKIDLHNQLIELSEDYEIDLSIVIKLKKRYSLDVLINKLERNYWNEIKLKEGI
tara:strand:- start:365 stop:562 length:198 start_codon:yes stop_codon:yes gene_type:complete